MAAPEVHALLGASKAYRWLNCPPSAKLAMAFPDSRSQYAEAGRVAHSVAELKARKHFIEPMGPGEYQKRLSALKSNEFYSGEMDENTDVYLDHLKELAMENSEQPFVALEVRLDLSTYVPESFGTADCIMISGDRLYIVDYKNGSGISVEAENNTQLMLYALGALETYRMIYGDSIKNASLSIVQPNAGGIKRWNTTVADLRKWGEEIVKPTALLAWEGKGEFNPGDWCEKNFCPARAQCTARAKKLLDAGRRMTVPEGYKEGTAVQRQTALYEEAQEGGQLLTDEEVGEILTQAQGIAKWVKELEEYALMACLKGKEIPGHKAVQGRASREWVGGTDKAFAALIEKGVAEALLYERKPLSVAQVEKALGKQAFTEAAKGLWKKTPGRPTLVPASDKRKAYVPAQTAFKPVDPAE